ncbi:EamA family transporter [Paenibacillus sp. NRS-1760]|uniref:EamA family transporter n=1 Tax=Paenibacillus sp. NRS-1760 TaxID=3233902 RepID=UPI003D26CB2F
MQSKVNYLFLILSIFFQSVSFIFSKIASLEMESNNFIGTMLNIYYLLSLFLLVLQAGFWQLTLRKVELSVAYPLTAFNNVFILIFSFYIFGEQITTNNILGVIIIMIGIVVLNLKSVTK